MIAIVNVNESWGIGLNGELLANIPEDMRFFRTSTAGSTVIMGRKTLESFPGMKPLKGRINIVLTSNPSRIKKESISGTDAFYCEENGIDSDEILSDIRETAVKNLELTRLGAKASEKRTLLIALKTKEEVLSLASYIDSAVNPASADASPIYVIGGAAVYRLFLADCGQCLVTKNDSGLKADTYFPNLDESSEWRLSEKSGKKLSECGLYYEFNTYIRV